jgi:flagellar protein FlaF
MSVSTKDMLNSYNSHQQVQVSDREIDAQALLKCAGYLKIAVDEGAGDFKSYGDAIRINQRLWTLFQVALCDPDNHLPRDLKTLLLNLSRYVDKVSFRAVANYAPDLLNSLIHINRTVAVGLAKKQPVSGQGLTQAPVMPDQPMSVMTSA